MDAVVFEDDQLSGFGSLTILRHASHLRWGTRTILESLLSAIPDFSGAELWGREELAEVTKETTKSGYNERVEGRAILVNARARPEKSLSSLLASKGKFAAFQGSHLVAASLDASSMVPGIISAKSASRVAKGAERLDLPAGHLFQGYWDMVASNGLAVAEQAKHFEDPLALPAGVEVKGPPSNLRVHGGAEVESHVTFDTRSGPVVIDEGASIESFSRLSGPCYIGPRSKVYSAQIGSGTSVFEGCKVGGQVENSVIMPHTNKAHQGYVGDAYVGEWVNLGAGSNFSNLKNTYGDIRLEVQGKKVDSGMLKLGPALGDMCKLSIGALVYAGRLLGTGSQVSGLASRNVPDFTYLAPSGKMVELRLDSVVETQRRSKERRGKTLTRAEEALIRLAFRSTSRERRGAGVKKGPLA